jgi:hypothetical protein
LRGALQRRSEAANLFFGERFLLQQLSCAFLEHGAIRLEGIACFPFAA